MEQPSPEMIREALREEVQRAHAEYLSAQKVFEEIASGPTGLPLPCATLKIEQLGEAHIKALQAYTNAIQDQCRYITHGIVPHHVKSKVSRKPSRNSGGTVGPSLEIKSPATARPPGHSAAA